MAVLNYQHYDHMPLVHFGYWTELLLKWAAEGHITEHQARTCWDGSDSDRELDKLLGWDYCWTCAAGTNNGLLPQFEYKVIEELPEGMKIVQNGNGLLEKVRDGAVSIPATVGTLLTGREAWENLYLPRLQPDESRWGGAEQVKRRQAELDAVTGYPVGMFAGSLYGAIRDMLGVENLSYLYADDEELYYEIIGTVGNLCYQNVKSALEAGARVDFLHFWEDICFKNGPLVSPAIFREHVAPYYKKINDCARGHGCMFTALDCDGCIDKLVPIWLENGVNIMFPIEVGTWGASIEPWREQYGRELRGVGGMDKRVFAQDYAAIDREIERLRPIVDLGGYIPCPDHRIPPDAVWENVQYYCDKMRREFEAH